MTSNQAVDAISCRSTSRRLEDSLAALAFGSDADEERVGDRVFADVGSQRVEVKVAGDSDALIVSAVPSSAFSAFGATS